MNPSFYRCVIICFLVIFISFPLKADEEDPTATSTTEKSTRSKSDTIAFRYAIYYLPVPEVDPRLSVVDAVKSKFRDLRVVEDLPTKPKSKCVLVEIVDAKEFPPPDKRGLHYFGRGLDERQADLLQESRKLVLLTFVHPKNEALVALRVANGLIESVARATKGLIWDDETRLMYTPDEWREAILKSTSKYPAVSNHITIHAYNTGNFARAITLGMSKFGLPDVVIEEFSWSVNEPMGTLINAICQVLVEGTELQCPGEFDLDLKSIKNEEVRKSILESLKDNAAAQARLELRVGKAEEGDPPNDLIELGFGRYEGPDVHAQQDRLLGELFGATDSSVSISHDAKILEASTKAKAKLPNLKRDFASGLRPNEYILVKAPFAIPEGGQEWMWVEIIKWEGGNIEGLLKNEPRSIPDLHGGQVVKIRQDDIFDYLRVLPDGSQEGNETGKIIAESQQ
jgi:uncharacterized protein YegJ (DUF2314 family)